jgi:hypothetical protein
MPPNRRHAALLVLFIILIALAVWTLLPFAASKPNDLGYVSACPFAPWSTGALLSVAAVLWAIRRYLVTRAE